MIHKEDIGSDIRRRPQLWYTIALHVNAHKTEYMCYNQTGNITTLDGASLRLVDKFTYLGSSVSSTENDIDTRLTKAWTAIDRLSIIWKSDLTDEMKRSFFQAVVVSILLYGCTTWTLTKRLEKKLDGNYTRMLRAILNESWRQHPTRRQLYGHLPPITKTIQVRQARHAVLCWRSKDEQKQDDQPELTYSSYVKTRDVTLKTCRRWWMIGRSVERGSGISVLEARHEDDDKDDFGNCAQKRLQLSYTKTTSDMVLLNHQYFLMEVPCGVVVIVVGNGHGDTSSNPGPDWLLFHIALIPLGKVWIQLFFLQLWVNSRAD